MKIAVLGPEGGYTEIAARRYKNNNFEFFDLIKDIFQAVEDNYDEGIVPLENQISGSVGPTLDCLYNSDLKIKKEISVAIDFVLVGKSDKYKIIAAPPQAIGQCSNFLHDKNVEIIYTADTVKAMKMAANDRKIAAIGTELGADHFNLKILKEEISDEKNNNTRFLVIAKETQDIGDRTSLVVYTKEDRSGLLYDILGIFKENKMNLAKVESRPYSDDEGYLFYIDFNGNVKDRNVQQAIKQLESMVTEVKVFGSYESVL